MRLLNTSMLKLESFNTSEIPPYTILSHRWYAWYGKADLFYAYLMDVHNSMSAYYMDAKFMKNEWFTRGWTLQELVAPAHVVFFTSEWIRIEDKRSLGRVLSSITQIDTDVFDGILDPRSLSVAKRMSWAAKRQATRPEDVAYCLMGLFDINMTMAFVRLQEEIMRVSDDESLFAWIDKDAHPDTLRFS